MFPIHLYVWSFLIQSVVAWKHQIKIINLPQCVNKASWGYLAPRHDNLHVWHFALSVAHSLTPIAVKPPNVFQSRIVMCLPIESQTHHNAFKNTLSNALLVRGLGCFFILRHMDNVENVKWRTRGRKKGEKNKGTYFCGFCPILQHAYPF